MENKTNNENSPFAKSYGGTKHGNAITYNPRKEFGKILKEFIDDNFDDVESRSDAIDLMVKDYFFRYAYKTKGYYEKTLVCVLSKGDIKYGLEDDDFKPYDYERFKDYNLMINFVGVLNRYVKSNYGEDETIILDDEMVNHYSMIGALAYDKAYKDLDPTMKNYVYDNIMDYHGNSLEDDAIVLELALNNNLDANFNGINCFENTDGTPNKNLHVGVNVVNLDSTDFHVDAFPIIYYWYLDQEFNIKIEKITKITNDDLEKLINKYSFEDIGMIGNLNQLLAIGTGYEIRLKEELKHFKDLQNQLKGSAQRIERLKKSIDMDKKVND